MSSIPSQQRVGNEGLRKAKRRQTAKQAPRKRAVRACDQCRRLKEKCEGGQPCTRCVRFRRLCRFKDATQTDGEFANSAELVERMTYMEFILERKLGGVPLDTSSLSQLANELAELEDDEDDHVTVSPLKEGELEIEDEVCTINPVDDTITHYSGEFSYWNFSMRIKRMVEDRFAGSLAQQSEGHDQAWSYWRAKQLRPASTIIAAVTSCIPPRHIADFLVCVFFKYAETHYFYVEKTWLLGKVNVLYANNSEFGMKDAATVSIVLTIFAIGTQYAYLDCSGHNEARNSSAPKFSEDELGTMFYREAVRLLPEIIESSSLESVQACLLFAAYSLPLDAAGLGYIYINLAIRLAMQNGMHRKCADDALSAALIETRNRVWWTAYTLERKISIFHGRPLAMNRSDIDTQLPNNWGDMSPTPTFNYMAISIYLTQRLEEFFSEISQLRNCQKQYLPRIISHLLTKKSELEAWWAALPSEVRDETSQPDAQFRPRMYVRLEYCLLRMFIGRPFLFSRAVPQPGPNSSEVGRGSKSPTDGTQTQNSDHQELVECCIRTAKEAVDICRALRDNGPGLARASYIEYSSCRAALLVLIAFSIQNQSDPFRRYLRDGLDMIREMSASGDSARSEVRLIEALERALARLHLFNAQQHRDDENTALAPADFASGYGGFKQWESIWKGNTSTYDSVASLYGSSAQLLAPQTLVSGVQHSHYTIDHELQGDFSTRTLNCSKDNPVSSGPDCDANLHPVRPFYSASDLALFSEGTMPASASNTTLHPEMSVLNGFLSNPDPRLFSYLGIASGIGSMDPTYRSSI